MVKNLPANAGDTGSIPGWKRYPKIGNGNPFQCSCLEKSMDREASRASPQGCKESDMTEQLSTGT